METLYLSQILFVPILRLQLIVFSKINIENKTKQIIEVFIITVPFLNCLIAALPINQWPMIKNFKSSIYYHSFFLNNSFFLNLTFQKIYKEWS